MYTIFAVWLQSGCAQNVSMRTRAVTGAPKRSHGRKHQCGYGAHADAEHVGVENHEEVAYEHPTEVASYIAHTIGKLADERHVALA